MVRIFFRACLSRGGLAVILPLGCLGLSVGAGLGQDLEARLAHLEKRVELLEAENRQLKEASTRPSTGTVGVEELRRQLGVLAAEMEKLRSGEEPVAVSERGRMALGLGPSAASVYARSAGVSLAGYGEMLYENFASENESGGQSSKGSQLDFLRMILYAGYRFNDKFLFNSEIEFEHASTDKSGSASVEFAYLDYLASPHLTLRGGLLLIPMGLTNELHEPNVFMGTRRPETETRIIPTTWRENGFGLVGSAGIFNYRAYLINGLDAGGFSSSGLRGGRQKGSKAKASDMAFVGRLDMNPTPGIFFGGSLYRGNSGQNRVINEKPLNVTTTIFEVHGQLQTQGLDVRGLFARADLDEVAGLNADLGLEEEASIGEIQQGGYLHVGYNLLALLSEDMVLSPHYRFEKVDTQNRVAQGFLKNPAVDGIFHTFGLEFKPIFNVVIKTDYQWIRNEARTGLSQFNIGLGYSF